MRAITICCLVMVGCEGGMVMEGDPDPCVAYCDTVDVCGYTDVDTCMDACDGAMSIGRCEYETMDVLTCMTIAGCPALDAYASGTWHVCIEEQHVFETCYTP